MGAVDLEVAALPEGPAIFGHAGEKEAIRRLRNLALERGAQVILVLDAVHLGRAEPPGSYRLGEPQNTNRPHDVTPNE